jgi:hypothetical protein
LDSFGGSFVRDGSDSSTTLLSSNKREIASIESTAMVCINKVDSGIFIFDNHLAWLQGWSSIVSFIDESVGITSLTNYGCLVIMIVKRVKCESKMFVST